MWLLNTLVLDDPPFYLPKGPLLGLDIEIAKGSKFSIKTDAANQPFPGRPALIKTHSASSTSEDYRSVIDDLTVENRKLKQRLKRYESIRYPSLQDEKLFEVRIHSLPACKKRELEDVLKQFAHGLEEFAPKSQIMFDPPQTSLPLQYVSSEPKPPSSSTSTSRPLDSAYASMSTSGRASTSQSQNRHVNARARIAQSNDQTVKTYLQDIPDNLLPKRAQVMSEKAKQRLVARRLERLFTGNCSPMSKCDYSLQQQESSQFATYLNRTATESKEHCIGAEGHREARILPVTRKMNLLSSRPGRLSGLPHKIGESDDPASSVNIYNSRATPEQRPTRPLELDPYRTQIPKENIEYIRHLGFESLDMTAISLGGKPGGWVYLNLLIGMAQLHTINVTPEFVRKAVTEVSAKFELSEDGTKIRWKGGTEGTSMTSDSGSGDDPEHGRSPDSFQDTQDLLAITSFDSAMEQRSGTDPSAFELSLADSEGKNGRRPIPLRQPPTEDRCHYEPLFFHADGCCRDLDALNLDNVSMSLSSSADLAKEPIECRTTSSQPSPLRPTSGLLKEVGPIIFYKTSSFCVDLSGDAYYDQCHSIDYAQPMLSPLGLTKSDRILQNWKHDTKLRDENADVFDAVSHMSLPDLEEMDNNGFESPTSSDQVIISSQDSYMPLEASGIGGVQPSDNFVINVYVRHFKNWAGPATTRLPETTDSLEEPPAVRRATRSPINTSDSYSRLGPTQFLYPTVVSEVISVRQTILAPATLPPPSYTFLPLSSASSGTDEAQATQSMNAYDQSYQSQSIRHNDSESSFDKDEDGDSLLAFLHTLSTSPSQAFLSSTDSDGSSIDMLAHAREIDPETVAAQERDFELAVRSASAEREDGQVASFMAITDRARSSISPCDAANELESRNASVACQFGTKRARLETANLDEDSKRRKL